MADRIFTEEFLQQAGQPSADKLIDAARSEDFLKALSFLKELSVELATMYYSYRGWEKGILKHLSYIHDQTVAAKALSDTEDYQTFPERDVDFKQTMPLWQQYLADIKAACEAEDTDSTVSLTETLIEKALTTHDGMMSRVACLTSLFHGLCGEEATMTLLQEVMQPEGMDPDGTLPVKEKILQLITFTRSHLLPFRLVEDDEKFTFMPDPCPSGGRLVQMGHYEAPYNNSLVKEASSLTYGRKDFPVYCCHEPAMEVASILKTGRPVFVVQTPEDGRIGFSPCKIHIYKDPCDIPDHYFERIGIERPENLIARSRS
ncbi:hypothetical protein [Endozoicomonas sp. OPT23]|uniref:hypothetical protein n=1 Tax=Endozoicomonas sp. OPT23 TaxID=2072845 RepID=UPI00129B990D|nr:hypothetical protein [Endozoicomonas sp. OPT23]